MTLQEIASLRRLLATTFNLILLVTHLRAFETCDRAMDEDRLFHGVSFTILPGTTITPEREEWV